MPELDIEKITAYQSFAGGQNRPVTGDFYAQNPIFSASWESRRTRDKKRPSWIDYAALLVALAMLLVKVLELLRDWL